MNSTHIITPTTVHSSDAIENRHFCRRLLLGLLLLYCYSFTQAQTNLALELEILNPLFPKFSATTVILSIENKGDVAASNIAVSFPALEQGVRRANEEMDVLSAGRYDIFEGIWSIPSIAVGNTERLELDLYALENPIHFFAQITALDQVDEQPDDDTATFTNEGLLHKFTYCPDDIIVTIPRGVGGARVFYPDPIFQTACGHPFEVAQLKPTDLPSGAFFPVGFTGTLFEAAGDVCGNLLCAYNVVVQERDETVDLELSASSDRPKVDRFERADYRLTVRNNSDTDASGIKVQLTLPEDMIQVGEFQPTASQGRYIPFYRLWEVGDLAAQTAATLDIAIFTLSDTAQALAQIISAEQADLDSTPSSTGCCEASEDDEVILNATSNRPRTNFPLTPNHNQAIATLFPNPTRGQLNVAFEDAAPTVAWSILDVNGQLIQSGQWEEVAATTIQTLALETLGAGVYYLRTQQSTTVSTWRFVKLY